MKKYILCGLALAASLIASWPLEVCGDDNLQLFPSVTKTSNGYITAFVDNNTDGKHCEIYAQRFTDDGSLSWGSALYVSNHDTLDGHRLATRVIPGNTDTAIVAWFNHKDFKIYAQKIHPDATKGWGSYPHPPKLIAAVAKHMYYEAPQMCSDGAGGVIFVWVEKEGDYYKLKARRIESDEDEPWTPSTKEVASSDIFITLPRICADGNGGAKIAWVRPEPVYVPTPKPHYENLWKVYLRAIDENGGLGNTIEVATAYDVGDHSGSYNRDTQRWTALALTVSGSNTILVMRRRFGYGITENERKIGVVRHEELFAVRVDADDNCSDPVEIDEYNYDGLSSSKHDFPILRGTVYSCLEPPVIAPAPSGGAYVAWARGNWDPNEGDKTCVSNVWVTKINSNGTAAWSNQKLSKNSCLYFYNCSPRIFAQDDYAVVTWQSMNRTFGTGTSCRLYYSKVLSDSLHTAPSKITDNNAWSFDAVGTGSATNGMVVVWTNKSGSNWDIYAHKVTNLPTPK